MSETDNIEVELRELVGKRNNRRLRDAGYIPAILYGHGEENVNLKLKAHEFEMFVHRGGRAAQLTGAVDEAALIKDLQWDTFASQILHVDFERASRQERKEVTVPVELYGEAPGAAGGILEQVVHELTIACPAMDLPETLRLDVKDLQLEQMLTAAEVELPKGAKLLTPSETVMVTCHPAHEQPETTEE